MPTPISRNQFLAGDFSGSGVPIRPPWALAEERFVDLCTRCGECIPVCEPKIIKEGRGKFPYVDFALAGCDFCQACVEVCEPGALVLGQENDHPPWALKATILPNCLSLNAVVCRSCGEACDERAIRFKLEVGGIARPLLDMEQCTGCGECFAVCPIKSITIAPDQPREHAA